MKTKNASPMRQLVLAALFLALAFVLPLLTGQVPKVGNMLCPMHFPVLLCGFVLGGPWGLAVGFAALSMPLKGIQCFFREKNCLRSKRNM